MEQEQQNKKRLLRPRPGQEHIALNNSAAPYFPYHLSYHVMKILKEFFDASIPLPYTYKDFYERTSNLPCIISAQSLLSMLPGCEAPCTL